MEIDFENEEVLALAEIVDEIYAGFLLERQMHTNHVPEELLRDRLFMSAKILFKLSKSIHRAKLCGCKDDLDMERQEKIFNDTFKKEIENARWWREQGLSRGQFRVASAPLPTSSSKIRLERPTHEQGQDRPLA